LIWIIGEYANKIDNADELLGIFVDTFTEESYPVRLCFDTPCLVKMLTMFQSGPTTNVNRCGQALLEQARFGARRGPTRSEYGNKRL
jgi:hypothetical protein